jgi:hypothetical protein
MQIANPIYDVVFKYLMEDAKIAKLLISSIIGEKIQSLDFRPQEYTADIDKNGNNRIIDTLTVYRLDFAATIKTSEGLKQVLIEIQKAKFATDIMRFRGYLGGQYSNLNNTEVTTINNLSRRVGIPIIGIYFLGHTLDHTDASVIGVNRTYTDLITGQQLTTKESFIESLSHDSYVIQIPNLKQKRRNDLEKLLSIFDQSTSVDLEHHILNIREEDFPKQNRSLIRRLQSAVLEPGLRKKMEIEDSVLLNIEDIQRDLIEKIAAAEQEASEAKQKTCEAEQKANEAEQKANEAKQEANEAKHEASEAKRKVALKLKIKGMSVADIVDITGLSLHDVDII